MKAKTIAIFSHKGGVSKTTTSFNVGWQLARKGKRVLLVDADSQCNLTLYTLGTSKFEKFYEGENNTQNIKDALEPAFKSKPRLIQPINCQKVKKNDNLFLLPGHLDLSENETQLGLSFQLREAVGALENLPGSFHYLFSKTAEKYNADFVILDMNPSLSAINQDLFISSDYFIVPTSPDVFSLMAVKSLSRILPSWENWAKQARVIFKDAEYPLPFGTPKFLGYTINDFNLSRTSQGLLPTRAFERIMDRIADTVKNQLVPNLKEQDMLLEDDRYLKAKELNDRIRSNRELPDYCIAEISNFNKLIAMSNESSTPVFELPQERLGYSQKGTHQYFKELFDIITQKILIMTYEGS